MNSSIEITIPILNEECTLDEQVRKAHQYIQSNLIDLGTITIILADNGSTDSTPDIARSLQLELPGVQYLRLEQRGVGRALKASWSQSKADIVGYMDLDIATDLRYLRPALEKLCADQADIVTGSRLAKGSRVIGRSLLRNFTSRALNFILKIVFRISFSDGMCGFKFLKRSCIVNLQNAGAVSDGWFFATEILIAGEYLGYRIFDLAVEWRDDPNSKVKIGKLAIEYLNAMRVLRRRLPVKSEPI
jgi:glycosyltransferase involved in cell wall biosynthesis